MILTTYTIGTPAGVFQANWDEDEEIPVSYTGDAEAIAFFRSYLELATPSGADGALVRFDAIEPDDFDFIQAEGITVLDPLPDPLDDQPTADDTNTPDTQMQTIYDSATDADTFTLIGEGAQLLAALDENSDSFFADLGRLREIVLALGSGAAAVEPTPEPAASTIDVDALPAVIATALPDGLPSDWIVMNAPRPLLGQKTTQGDFLHGRFYAAINPADKYSQGFIDRNVKDDAYVVFVADQATQIAMALNTIDPEYLPAYLEMDEQDRADSLGAFIADLNKGKTFGELKALAAKGMPTVPAATTDEETAPVIEPPAPVTVVTSSPSDETMQKYIAIAADSIDKLRRIDVYRVLEALAADNPDGVTRAMLATWIVTKRPDLAQEVATVMAEEWPGDGWTAPTAVTTTDPAVTVTDPLPEGGTVVPPVVPAENANRAADLDFLKAVAAQSIDMMADGVAERIETTLGAYPGDAEIETAVREAVAAYTDYMTKAIGA